MQTVHDVGELRRGRPTVLTIGAFDGVHRGHQYLIRQVVDRARALDIDSVVITFDPRPLVVLRPGSTQLTGAEEKERIIGAIGPGTLVVLPFSRELAQIPAGQFLVSLLEHINLAEIWVGADFAFGHNREGNVQFLLAHAAADGFGVHVLSRRSLDGHPLSSTAVRDALAEGNVAEAATLLGHYFRISGVVARGHGRGAEMSYPTANLALPPTQALTATGIYAGFLTTHEVRHAAAISVGTNPTFGDNDIVVEAFVLDFSGDLRNKHVHVDFVARLRPEERFDSVEALVAQMDRDVEETRSILADAQEPGELLL